MEKQILELMNHIAHDYAAWKSRGEYGKDTDYEDFLRSLSIDEGRKYYKVVSNNLGQETVWGFVVKEDEPLKDGKSNFKAGDILKAASWASPARNKPRGNIIQGDFSWVRWTGPEYL